MKIKVDHHLKTWPQFFDLKWKNIKTFGVRENDRGFKEGDTVYLAEYDPETGMTGRYLIARITYILSDFHGLAPGYVVLQYEWVEKGEF